MKQSILLHGWDSVSEEWIPLKVDASGNVKVDLSEVNLGDLGDVNAPSPDDEDVLTWDNASELWIPQVVAGATSSKALAYRGTSNQVIPTASAIRVCLNAESFDVSSEFDIAQKTGAADATQANKLHDADGGFDADDVGKWLWNTTDNTYTTISGFVDSGELDLAGNIMVNGENYIIYNSIFVAGSTGFYLAVGSVWFVGLNQGTKYVSRIQVNGATKAEAADYLYVAGQWPTSKVSQILSLSAGDAVELVAYHEHGSNRDIYSVPEGTFLSIHRLS